MTLLTRMVKDQRILIRRRIIAIILLKRIVANRLNIKLGIYLSIINIDRYIKDGNDSHESLS